MEIVTFTMPLDASLFNFKWKQAQTITVKYGTAKEGDKITVVVSDLSIGFSLMWDLNNKLELKRQIESAAMHNANSYWKDKEQHPATDLSNINEHFHGAFARLTY